MKTKLELTVDDFEKQFHQTIRTTLKELDVIHAGLTELINKGGGGGTPLPTSPVQTPDNSSILEVFYR
jgi:hypothetical protein